MLQYTGLLSAKLFTMPNNTQAQATKQLKTHHSLQEPTNRINLLPDITLNSLISGPKLANAGYTTIFT
jgi:hypothetical protein